MPALTAPRPIQPTPVEIASWNAARSTARQNYDNAFAQNQFQRNQATIGYNAQRQQMQQGTQQARQRFDDPYLERGVFRSGIRFGGLNMFRQEADTALDNAQNAYLAQLGQLDTSLAGAWGSYDTTIRNIAAQQQARENQIRQDLANAIKGVV
jgi:hypothetical protein